MNQGIYCKTPYPYRFSDTGFIFYGGEMAASSTTKKNVGESLVILRYNVSVRLALL